MGITEFAQDLAHGVESRLAAVSGALFDPVIRLGVTGLSRAGKTVFITSLVSNLLDRGRMPQLRAADRIAAVWLQPQPDVTIPRFDYEGHRAALTGPQPRWPDSTRSISELRLSFRLRGRGLPGLLGDRQLHLDIIDYPGEWLLDLPLLEQSYHDWASATLTRTAGLELAADYHAQLAGCPDTGWDEGLARRLADGWRGVLGRARQAGRSQLAPGRFLLPGDLDGSPVLTFAPLPRPPHPARTGLWREMERRYDAYRTHVVRPFFRDHFARIDRQVVLVDALAAIHAGPAALEDMRQAMAGILGAFRTGRRGVLADLLRGRRVERILFAATRADHLHHRQHDRLAAILTAMLREARDRADFTGAQTAAMAIAALRATTEVEIRRDQQIIPAVQGILAGTGRPATIFAGTLPDDPARLLDPARQGATEWPLGDYAVQQLAPAPLDLAPGQGLPHIRLDRAAEFLIGDRL